MRNEGADAAPLSDWLDRRLAAIGTTADEIVHLEHQRQSAREISVRNAINSLRGLAAIDWSESFERLSYVERILQTDPDGTYAAMDTASAMCIGTESRRSRYGYLGAAGEGRRFSAERAHRFSRVLEATRGILSLRGGGALGSAGKPMGL